MNMTKVVPHKDHQRSKSGPSGAEYNQMSSRDGGYTKVSDSKFYSRSAGEYAPVSAKTDGMCK